MIKWLNKIPTITVNEAMSTYNVAIKTVNQTGKEIVGTAKQEVANAVKESAIKAYNSISKAKQTMEKTAINAINQTTSKITQTSGTIKDIIIKTHKNVVNTWQNADQTQKQKIHTTLNVIGMIPLLGEPADIVNGILYAMDKDYINAILSFVLAIPVADEGVGVVKIGERSAKLSKYGELLLTKVRIFPFLRVQSHSPRALVRDVPSLPLVR